MLNSDEIIRINEEDNKKWILLFTGIYIVALIISSTLIYQKKLSYLKNIQINNIC